MSAEANARAAKVAALVASIDKACLKSKVDPYEHADEIAQFVSRWGHEEWAALAVTLGKRPPNAETRAMVIGAIRARTMPRLRLVQS